MVDVDVAQKQMESQLKKQEHSEESQFEICSNDKKDSLCDENDVNPASSQWRWRDFFFYLAFH